MATNPFGHGLDKSPVSVSNNSRNHVVAHPAEVLPVRIRWKLLTLLLVTALAPLGVVTLLRLHSLQRLEDELSSQARAELIERADRQLRQLTDNYARIVQQTSKSIELMLAMQQREAERVLAAEPTEERLLYQAGDFDSPDRRPPGMVSSPYYRYSDTGAEDSAILISRDYQVYKTAPGVAWKDVRESAAKLAPLTPVYRFLNGIQQETILWQYTALANGLHGAYPGHGGYPEDYDPRSRPWYRNTIEADQPLWNAPIIDAPTHRVVLTIAAPLKQADGSTAGVTAVDVDLIRLLESVSVPFAWSKDAQTLLVMPADNSANPRMPQAPSGEPAVLVIAQRGYAADIQDWRVPIQLELLTAEPRSEMQRMVDDLRAQSSGLRHMTYRSRDSIWVHAPIGDQTTSLLLIVPHDEIIAHAVEAEQMLLGQTRQLRKTAIVTLAVVVLLVVIAAFLGSRVVTHPVAELANVARRVAGGDLDVRSNIRSRDELGQLGRTINQMIPQLIDRLRIRDSLSLAMDVQQHLLPSKAPNIEGLDIAGHSVYCDETGGDYYDFLELTELGPQRIGIAVGDVTGHGVAAALLMATARAMLRSRAGLPASLAQMIGDVNRQLSADTGGNRFMTFVYMIMDARSRRMQWVNAGHDPAIVYSTSNDTFSELTGGGIPMGIDADWRYEESEAAIPNEGQVIVIGTDGIWEARNERDEMYGKDRLRQVIRANAERSAQEISAAIAQDHSLFRGEIAQEDDVTLVVVKVLPA